MKKILLFIVIVVTMCSAGFRVVHASTVYVNTPENTFGIGQELVVDIYLDAEQSINVVELGIHVNEGAEVVRILDSGSIVSLWVEKPVFNSANRTISLSGVVPGGFQGQGGRIVQLVLKATTAGSLSISFDTTKSKILLNDGQGTEDAKPVFRIKTIVVTSEKNEDITEVSDSERPEDFLPIITRDPSLYEGRWVLLFQTQDKASGLKQYEVQESDDDIPDQNAWAVTESPYILKDQSRGSFVFIKAVDYQGNEIVKKIPPKGFGMVTWIILTLLCIAVSALLIYSVYYIYKKHAKGTV
ncbi:hypothetical protein KW782_01435 [Candidatus Parcubacteria bacterium]|nr:hypothetical protein [Candidatus Parcubacteria bacterium]